MVAKEITTNCNVSPDFVKVNDCNSNYPLYCNEHFMEAYNANVSQNTEVGIRKESLCSAERWISRVDRKKPKKHKPIVEAEFFPMVTIDDSKSVEKKNGSIIHKLRVKTRVKDKDLLREILDFVNNFKDKTLPESTSINLELL